MINMKIAIQSSLEHGLLAIPIFFVAALAIAYLPWMWFGVLLNIAYWGGRELAQSFRPSAPYKLNWTLTSTLNFVTPVVVATALALGFTFFW